MRCTAGLFNAALTKISYSGDLTLSIKEMIGALGPRTRLVALANPNSPTGTICSRNEIIDLIHECNLRDIIVLIDEAYYPFYPETVVDLIQKYPDLIVTRTFSKAFGLASLRLGYAVADPRLIRSLSSFRPIYETHSFAVALGCAVLENPGFVKQNVKQTLEGRHYLENEMKRLGFFPYPSYSNFVNIRVNCRNRRSAC